MLIKRPDFAARSSCMVNVGATQFRGRNEAFARCLRATMPTSEASADRVTVLNPARSSHQIVFLMLGALALFQQEPKIKKCVASEI